MRANFASACAAARAAAELGIESARRALCWIAHNRLLSYEAVAAATEWDTQMKGDDGDRRDEGSRPLTRRVVLAASGAVLLTSTVAAMTAEFDARAHATGTGTRSRSAAADAVGRSSARASAAAKPAQARPATSPPARQHPELTRHAARPPRHAQPRLAYGEPMYTVQDGPKVVALTIDDGPSPVYTPQILKILRQYGVIASFSMVGRNAAAFPGVAREVAAAGHMIVNHTWNHYNLRDMSAVAVQDEIAQATDAIHAATGERPSMFRAPYGIWPADVFSYCARAGLTPLAWSVDPRDWSRPGIRAIVRDIEADTRTGSIILEHDGGGNRSQTVAALKIWLPRLIDAGYQFTTP
jgi:peptidoglycan-N-acetylglucosamine deacetylase